MALRESHHLGEPASNFSPSLATPDYPYDQFHSPCPGFEPAQTFSLGTLGSSIFYLGLIDSCLTILFFNLLCTLPVAFFSTWGKSTGLRQMVLGRYSFGVIGIYFPVLLNCIACIGWSTVNTIIG